MKVKAKIKGRVLISGGKIISPPEFTLLKNEFIETHEGKEFDVTYDATDSRSKRQNDFFHSVVLPATMRTLSLKGMPNASNREIVKELILKKPYLTVNQGTPEEYVRPTSSLSVQEFWSFCVYCIDFIMMLGGDLKDNESAEYIQIIKDYNLDKGELK